MALRLVGPVRNPEKKLAMSIGSGELIQLVWEKQATLQDNRYLDANTIDRFLTLLTRRR
jgi:hypothetical protein